MLIKKILKTGNKKKNLEITSSDLFVTKTQQKWGFCGRERERERKGVRFEGNGQGEGKGEVVRLREGNGGQGNERNLGTVF